MSDPNFTGKDFANKAGGFVSPTQRPDSEETRSQWQEANRSWWTDTPMRYDWREAIQYPEHSQEYFDEVDRRFFDSSKPYMPYRKLPFEREIPYSELAQLDVLEIGVGQGSHAGLIAPRSKSYFGIDLTDPATEGARKRIALLGLKNATIQQMDAEEMTFPDNSFDYIWTWGVIHHSADTRRILEHMHRTLRPGGRANVMVYNRSLWKYYIFDGFLKGIVQGRVFRGKSLHEINQAATDGAIARYYKKGEWTELAGDLFVMNEFRIYGLKNDVIPLPAGRFKEILEKLVPDSLSRFFTNTLGWGSFLIIHMTRK